MGHSDVILSSDESNYSCQRVPSQSIRNPLNDRLERIFIAGEKLDYSTSSLPGNLQCYAAVGFC